MTICQNKLTFEALLTLKTNSMKKLTWTLVFSLVFNFVYAQFDEWFGIMHGAEFYYTPEFGACAYDNPFQDYSYSNLLDDYCVSVSANGLPDERMESIHITPEGEVMMGTHSGFAIYHPDQSWRTYFPALKLK